MNAECDTMVEKIYQMLEISKETCRIRVPMSSVQNLSAE